MRDLLHQLFEIHRPIGVHPPRPSACAVKRILSKLQMLPERSGSSSIYSPDPTERESTARERASYGSPAHQDSQKRLLDSHCRIALPPIHEWRHSLFPGLRSRRVFDCHNSIPLNFRSPCDRASSRFWSKSIGAMKEVRRDECGHQALSRSSIHETNSSQMTASTIGPRKSPVIP